MLFRSRPLRRRAQPMWARESGDEPDDEEVEAKVRSITSLRAADTCSVKCPVELYGPNNPVPEVNVLNLVRLDFSSIESSFLTRIFGQGRSSFVSLPPLMENGPHAEAEVLKEVEEDDDELPSATSPSEEVEEDDEDEEPLPKRQKRNSGESASASSPLNDTGVDKEEMSESSSGAGEPVEPLVVPPLNSAPPSRFARMPSVSVGSEDDADVTRLVA